MQKTNRPSILSATNVDLHCHFTIQTVVPRYHTYDFETWLLICIPCSIIL